MGSSALNCPHCGGAIFHLSKSGDRLKAPTSMIVLHKGDGGVEINCPGCKGGVIIPLVPVEGDMELRKALPKRKHLLRKGLDSHPGADAVDT